MKDPDLGRLEPVDLETVWNSEPAGFTPWLAEPQNLGLLGEALGFGLELEGLEMAVGAFRADIVCRESRSGARVLIENQLGRSDHGHLGQTFTYAAGLDAAAVVWVARRFADEHRAALDWLNRIAGGQIGFFGVEIKLWRIDDSRVAPSFNLVARPACAAAEPDPRTRTDPRREALASLQKEYWAGVLRKLDSARGPVSGKRRPSPTRRMVFRAARRGFDIVASTTLLRRHVRVQLFVCGKDADERFGLLERRKAKIERELGYALSWERQPRAHGRVISLYLHNADPDDEADWPRQHEWIADRVNELHRVFARRMKGL